MASRRRVLIADDHNLVAELCKRLLEKDFDVVGVVGDGLALLSAAGELNPDVIVLDVAMPIMNGLEAGRRAKKLLPTVKLVYLTMNSDTDVAAEAFTSGASGYLLKTCAAPELTLAVHQVLRGKVYLSKPLSRDTINALRWQQKQRGGLDVRLSDRQVEVLQLLAEGKVMKEVGSLLNMSTRTVAYHKYRMMEALGVKNSAELVKYAVRNHVVAA
jgi:DNA-binding NarL/FixJ family response regulator